MSQQQTLVAAVQLHQAGRMDEAERLYRHVLAFEPDSADALHLLGLIANGRGEGDRATALIVRAIRLFPELPMVHYNLGNALRLSGRTEEACQAYRLAIAKAPETPGNYYNLAWTKEDRGEALDAAVTYERCSRFGTPSRALLFKIVSLYADARRQRETIGVCIRALDLLTGEPEDWEMALSCCSVPLNMAWIDDAMLARAFVVARRLLRASPRSRMAIYFIGHYLYHTGRMAAACRFGHRALKRFSIQEISDSNHLRVWYISHVDRAFFATIAQDHADPAALPPIHTPPAKRTAQGDAASWPVFYFSCDNRYFHSFGPRLIESIALSNPGATVHFHVMGPDATALETLGALQEHPGVAFNYTMENLDGLPPRIARSAFLRTYYASARFIRLRHVLDLYRRPVAQLDMDAILVGRFASVLEGLPRKDIHVFQDGIPSGPSREFNASLFLVNDTEAARRYVDLVGRYITHYMLADLPFWMLDQAALYCTYVHVKDTPSPPSFGFIHSRRAAEAVFYSSSDSFEEKLQNLDRRMELLRNGAATAGQRIQVNAAIGRGWPPYNGHPIRRPCA